MAEKKHTETLKEDAKGRVGKFEHEGVTYTVPPMTEWSVDAVEALENEKMVSCVRAVLGEAQYRKFKAHTGGGMKSFNELADLLFDALEGIDAGE